MKIKAKKQVEKEKNENIKKSKRSLYIINAITIIIGIIITVSLLIISKSVAQTEEVNNFILTSKVNLSAANGKGGVDLDWSSIDSTNKTFMLYQQKEGSDEWQSISTVDFYSNIEPIKVLNVYPTYGSPTVTFKYLDGSSARLNKSAALKVWMEGGEMIENGRTTKFEPYGKNPITGQQLLYITPITSGAFNANPNVLWNYDVVMFGTWDANGRLEDQPNDRAINVIEEYIKKGYGVLCGHDTIGYSYKGAGLNKLRRYFNIKTGYWSSSQPGNIQGIDYQESWGYRSDKVKVDRKGLLTNFPWELPLGTILNVPSAHTCANAAQGDVWMNFYNGSWWNGQYKHSEGNPTYYLTTNNNTAMIQTGHSNCASTSDERKILANTLFYLKQRTSATSTTDNSAQDLAAPDAPKIKVSRHNETGYINIKYQSNDNGSQYLYYAEAREDSNYQQVMKSNITSEVVTTGVEKYYYVIDEQEENNFDISNAQGKTTTEDIKVSNDNYGKWVHVRAVDYAGNIGDVASQKIEHNVTLNKSAKWVDAQNAMAEISLDVNVKKEEENNPLDIVIVQDISTSMRTFVSGKTRMEWSKEALTEFSNKIYNAAPDSRIALITFGSSAENKDNTYIPCGLTDIKNKENLISKIKSLAPNGAGTDFSSGLKKAIEIVEKTRDPNRDIFILFVTDGEPYPASKNGLAEAKELRAMNNVTIYGIGIGLASNSAKNNIKNICGSENFSSINSGADFDTVYTNIFKNIVSYTNENIVCTDTISKYFKLVENQNLGENVNIEGNILNWNIGTMRSGSNSLKVKIQLRDEYRYSSEYLNTKYETNDNAELVYEEHELITDYRKKYKVEVPTPILNYNTTPEIITIKIEDNNETHGTEYFGLFTDTTTTKTDIVQSINYAQTDTTSFVVSPSEIYYLYMVDSEGNKLANSNFWYYEVKSTVGNIVIIKDGVKITNEPNCVITQTPDDLRPSNVTNDILDVRNSQNQINLKRIWLTILGTVWNDKDKDGINAGNTDEGMENITVILHSKNARYGDKTLSTKTDKDGKYKFERIEISNSNYVEFKYNGQYYEPTIYKVGDKEDSKGVDNINERKDLNRRFYEISSSPNNYAGGSVYTREYLQREGYIDKYGNPTSRKNQFVDDCMTSSYTGHNIDNVFYTDYYPTSETLKKFGEKWSSEEKNIYVNQGFIEREKVDIAINQDIAKVKLEINGETEDYQYSKRANVYEINEKLANYYDKEYSRELYKADYLYQGEKPLEIYVTYRIGIRNNSENIMVVPNEIVDYYNEDYTLKECGVRDLNGNTYNNILAFKETSRYGGKSAIPGYKTVYITTNSEIKMKAGSELHIYLTFSVNKENGLVKLNNTKSNITEINSYKTYYSDSCFMPNANNPKTQQEFKEGDEAGIIDYDSTPGNAKIQELGQKESLQGIPEEILKNNYGIEDDTDIAPIINFTYSDENGNGFTRTLSGTVWEDERNKDFDLSRIGDGVMNENAPAKGVIVELIDLEASQNFGQEVVAHILGDDAWIEARQITDENGNYEFKGYIPSTYVVKFIYGTQGENNNIKYNGQDYKSTIYYTPCSESNGYSTYDYNNPDKDNYIYNLRQADIDNNPSDYDIDEEAKYYSDARDIMSSTAIGDSNSAFYKYENNDRNTGNRKYVNNYSNNYGNGVTNSLAQELQDTTTKTYMIAKSGKIIANIEYNRKESKTSNTGAGNVGNKNYELSTHYKIDHLDFGIVERPKAQLKVSQRVSHVKLILSNGSTLFDTSGSSTNVLWQNHIYHLPDTINSYLTKDNGQTQGNYDNNNLMKIPAARGQNGNKGIIQLTMDNELMHGANVQITYAITIANVGEIDYTSNQFYYSGVKETNDKIATTTPKMLIDYVGFQLDTGHVTRNNIHFISEDNPDWLVLSNDEITSLLSKEALKGKKEYTTVIATKDTAKISQAKLVPILASQGPINVEKIEKLFDKDPLNAVSIINQNYAEQQSSVVGVQLVLSQNIASDNKNDDLTYNNLVELVKVDNTVGRRMAYSVVGNQNPTKIPQEIDADDCQEVAIMPPYGEDRIYYMLIITVASILILGIILTISILKRKK